MIWRSRINLQPLVVAAQRRELGALITRKAVGSTTGVKDVLLEPVRNRLAADVEAPSDGVPAVARADQLHDLLSELRRVRPWVAGHDGPFRRKAQSDTEPDQLQRLLYRLDVMPPGRLGDGRGSLPTTYHYDVLCGLDYLRSVLKWYEDDRAS